MTKPAARFFLTRRDALELRRIHARSRREWGDDIARRYIAGLYAAMRHFVIYDVIEQGIVVLTLQHQMRDIETLIAQLDPALLAEVEALKRRM
ncbi:MAG: hypothetical protein H3C57_09455 [Gammaproteobacteria bacterium]|nr:hypothetical protein [Gammaproteobacteria bacterium]